MTAVPAHRQSVPISFVYTGTIISQQDAALQARVTGDVTARPFEPGSHVKKGQLLFRIDKRPFEVALAQAKAQEAQAKAQLQFAQAEVDRTDSSRTRATPPSSACSNCNRTRPPPPRRCRAPRPPSPARTLTSTTPR